LHLISYLKSIFILIFIIYFNFILTFNFIYLFFYIEELFQYISIVTDDGQKVGRNVLSIKLILLINNLRINYHADSH